MNPVSNSSINIPALISFYFRKWYWVALSVGVFGALGLYSILKKVPVVPVEASMLISTDTSSSISSFSEMASLAGLSSGGFGSNRSVHDEMVILSSHQIMLDLTKELDLNVQYTIKKGLRRIPIHKNYPVTLEYDKAIADTLSTVIFFKLDISPDGRADIKAYTPKKTLYSDKDVVLPATVETPYGAFTLAPSALTGSRTKETIMLDSYDGAAIGLAQSIGVNLSSKKTDIIEISYLTNDPSFGKQVIDSLMSSYKELTVKQQREYLQYTLEFINHRIATLASELNLAEVNIEQFMTRRDLVNPEAQAGIFLTQNNRQEQELIKAENEHELLRLAIEFLSTETNNSSLLPIMPSIISLTPLIEGYNELILERITIEPSARGDNAALRAMNIRIDAVKKNLMTALQKHYEMAQVEIEDLRRQFADSRAKMETLPGIEREYVNIKRQQSLQEQLFMFLLRQREETSLNIAGAQPLGIVIDKAYVGKVSTVASPKIMLLFFLFLGACFPVAFIIAFWKFNGRVNTVDQAEALTGMSSLAELPVMPADTSLSTVSDPLSLTATRYRLLRSNLLAAGGLTDGGVIAVCGTTDNHSMSAAVAANLAASLCGVGHSVAIVDADLFNSPLASVLDVHPGDALNAAIAGSPVASRSVNLAEGYKPLDIVTSEPQPARAADNLASAGFRHAIDALRANHDYVIVLLPSTGNFAAVEAASTVAGTIVGTIILGKTRSEAANALSTLADAGRRAYFVALGRR